MENMPLLLFTLCIQAAIGMMLFVGVSKLFNKNGVYKTAIVTAAVISVIGLVASVFHLARPFAAINALMQFGTSWLSREIWFSSIFAGLTVVAAIFVVVKPAAKNLVTVLSWAAAVFGLVDIFMMGSSYMFSSVPVWDSAGTMIEFYMAAITMGAVLFYALSQKEAPKSMRNVVAAVVFSAVIVQVIGAISSYISMGASDSAAMESSMTILSSMGVAMVVKWLCILLGAGLLLWPWAKEKGAMSLATLVYTSALLLVVGQLAGRYMFYETMVTTGIGLT